jgi:hypothetical protein
MAYQAINRGTSANDGTGDDLRTGAGKVNANFVEFYTYLGDGTTISSDPAVTETATQTLTNKTITGTFTGNITGNVTGNADTATALAAAVTIAGKTFDGTSNVIINAADLGDVDQAVATTDSPTFVNVTSDLTGDVTGDITGNITSAGTSTFSGTVDFAGATISNLTAAQTGFISLATLQTETAAALDFSDFQTRIAAL